MDLSLLDLVVPGVGPVAAALNAICAVAGEMEELSELCQHVYGRLAVIYDKLLAMEKKKTLPSDHVLKDYSAVVGEYKAFLDKYRGRRWIYRLISYKRVMPKVRDFQEKINTLMLTMHLCHMDAMADERVRMEAFRQQQERAIEDRLTDDATVAKEVVREVEQVEALTVLRYELLKDDSAMPAANHQKVVKRALDKVMRLSSVTVMSVPEWFLHEHKVEYKRLAFGRGSFGTVHHGRMDFMDVVVKCLLVDTRDNKNITDRFRKEADLWFQFRHKHVLTMYGACDVSSPPFIVCEHAINGNLFNYLSEERNQPFTFQLLFEAASGLAYLHGKSVVHADLKCDNILVAGDRTAKIADFSFSYVRTLSASKNSVGAKAGAFRWRAPECLGDQSPTPASDVYSFGMCIIEAVSQEIPWGYLANDDAVRDLVLSRKLPDKPDLMADHVWSLVERMCSFEPASRPSLELIVEHLGELALDETAKRMSLSVDNTQALPRDAGSLEDAIKQDNVGGLSKFLTSAAALEKPDSVGATPLILAAIAGAVKVTENLISRGAKLDVTTSLDVEMQGLNDKGCTALHVAAHFGHSLVAKALLLARPVLIGVPTVDQKTAMYFALRAGHATVTELLLLHEADTTNTGDQPALHVASAFGNTECVRVLLLNKVNVNAVRSDGSAALHTAAFSGHADVVEELLRHGAAIDAPDEEGRAALYCAAREGMVETVRVLLRANADVNAKTKYAWTALHAAAWKGRVDVIEELLLHGAAIDASIKNGATALYWAAEEGKIDAVRVLLRAKANVNAKRNDALSALHMAAWKGHANVVEELLLYGATIDAPTESGTTALYWAAHEGKLGAVRVLLRAKADVNAKMKDASSALHVAALEGHADVIEELLLHGAAIDASTKNGATALYLAAEEGKIDAVRMLLDAGATVTKAALQAASSKKHNEVSAMLEARTPSLLGWLFG